MLFYSLKVAREYERLIQQYSVKCFEINEKERVYVIEDSFIIYLGIIDYSYDYYEIDYVVQFEELLNNEIFKFNYTKFSKNFSDKERNQMRYKFFRGQWAEPIREVGEMRKELIDRLPRYLIESKSEYVNTALPFLELKNRYEKWEGYVYHFIVYELSNGEKTGYAIYCSSNPQIHKIARQKAYDVVYCALEYYTSPYYKKHHCVYSPIDDFMGGIHCDKIMIELLIDRIEQRKSQGRKGRKGLAEKDLKYFYITKHIKWQGTGDVETRIFKEAQRGLYKNETRYEYLIPENKWKSEQLVFELTKKLYKKYTVLYQHRPYFLKTQKGQMSYDVFICGLDVAIEYQGKQHFEPVEIFGGQDHYDKQVERDRQKKSLSKANGVKLVYINYWEDISPDLIKEKVENALKD